MTQRRERRKCSACGGWYHAEPDGSRARITADDGRPFCTCPTPGIENTNRDTTRTVREATRKHDD